MTEDADGAYGSFRLYDGPHLPKVRSMLAESHTGLSIEFTDVAAPVVDGSLRRRRQINVSHVTATPIPAYPSAGILAMRAAGDVDVAAGTPNLDRVRAMLADLKPALARARRVMPGTDRRAGTKGRRRVARARVPGRPTRIVRGTDASVRATRRRSQRAPPGDTTGTRRRRDERSGGTDARIRR